MTPNLPTTTGADRRCAARDEASAAARTSLGRVSEVRARDALVIPPGYTVEPAALNHAFSDDEGAALQRYLKLADELRRCRYFTQEERSLTISMADGITTSHEVVLPDAGATRDMLGVLRQLFGDRERASFASMAALVLRCANEATKEGRLLLQIVHRFQYLRQGVLDSWDARPGGSEDKPHPPLTVFLDWMYGEYLHSDADKAERIARLDGGPMRLYEWQFHWVAERLAALYTSFSVVVRSALDPAWNKAGS